MLWVGRCGPDDVLGLALLGGEEQQQAAETRSPTTMEGLEGGNDSAHTRCCFELN